MFQSLSKEIKQLICLPSPSLTIPLTWPGGSKEDTLDTLPLDLDVIVEDHEPLAVADAKEDGKEDDQREVAEVPLATPQNSFMLSDSFDYDKPTNDGTDPSKAAKKEVGHGGANQHKCDDMFAHYWTCVCQGRVIT